MNLSQYGIVAYAIAFAALWFFENRPERVRSSRAMFAYWSVFSVVNLFVYDLSIRFVESIFPLVDVLMCILLISIGTRHSIILAAMMSIMSISGFLVMWEPVYDNYESIVYCTSTAMLMISSDGIFQKIRAGIAGVAGTWSSGKPALARVLSREVEK